MRHSAVSSLMVFLCMSVAVNAQDVVPEAVSELEPSVSDAFVEQRLVIKDSVAKCLEQATSSYDCLPLAKRELTRDDPPIDALQTQFEALQMQNFAGAAGGFSVPEQLGIDLGDLGDRGPILGRPFPPNLLEPGGSGVVIMDACAAVDPMQGYECVPNGRGGFTIVPIFVTDGTLVLGRGTGFEILEKDGTYGVWPSGKTYAVFPSASSGWGSGLQFNLVEVGK